MLLDTLELMIILAFINNICNNINNKIPNFDEYKSALNVLSDIENRIDEELKRQAVELFEQLGMDMSGAVNMFLRQCVMRGGLPFAVEVPRYKPEVLEAMEEAKRISRDPATKRYASFKDALKDLDE